MAVGFADRLDHLGVFIFRRCGNFTDRQSGHRHLRGIQQIAQFFHNGRHTARVFEISQRLHSAGNDLGYIGRGAADLLEILRRDGDAAFPRNCRDMQQAVGRTADRHRHLDGIDESRPSQERTGFHPIADEVDDPVAAGLGNPALDPFDRVGCRTAGHRQSEYFRNNRHAVGRTHHRTGTRCRGQTLFHLFEYGFRQQAALHFPCGFLGVVGGQFLAAIPAWHHRPAGDHDGRDIEARRRH